MSVESLGSLPEGIADQELAKVLADLLVQYQFELFSDSQNVAFTHRLVSAVLEKFDYLALAGSEEFSAAELPASLKVLAARTWSPGGVAQTVYSDHMEVRVLPREQDLVIPAHVPGLDEALQAGLTFEEAIESISKDIQTNPETFNQLRQQQVIPDEAVVVRLSEKFNSNWGGIDFIVEPGGIDLNIFGQAGNTDKWTKYLLTYHNKPRELAHAASQLAILGARYCLPRRQGYSTSIDEVAALCRSIKG